MMSESWESPDAGPEQVPEGSEDLTSTEGGLASEGAETYSDGMSVEETQATDPAADPVETLEGDAPTPDDIATTEEPVPEEPVSDEAVYDEAVYDEPVPEEPVFDEPAPETPPGNAPSPEPPATPHDLAESVTTAEDPTSLSQDGLPQDWLGWEPPGEIAPDSFRDCACSSEWGTVAPAWEREGEEPFAVTPAEPLSDVVGPGHAADIYWADQGDTNYCALYSARSILSELYGYPVDPNEIVRRADASGWLVRDGGGEIKGVMPNHFDDLLASYGVPSHNFSGEQGAWQALNDALVNDRRVILSLDGKELDSGANVGDVAGGLDSDHAVAITGVDYGRGVVIVNDSARGAGLEIPVDVFYDSWRDSNFAMTVTEAPVNGGAPPGGEAAPRGDTPGLAVLPMTLHPSLGVEGAGGPPTLADMPEEGPVSTGSWWCAAASPEECSTVPESAAAPESLRMVDSNGGEHAVPGVDLTGDGRGQLGALDANGDGGTDTWLSDAAGEGRGTLMFIDTDGDGRPDAFSADPTGEGKWSDPRPLDSLVADGDGGQPDGLGPEVTGDPEAAAPLMSGVMCGLLGRSSPTVLSPESLPPGVDGALAGGNAEGVLSVGGNANGVVDRFVAIVGELAEKLGFGSGQAVLLALEPGGDAAGSAVQHGLVFPTSCGGEGPADEAQAASIPDSELAGPESFAGPGPAPSDSATAPPPDSPAPEPGRQDPGPPPDEAPSPRPEGGTPAPGPDPGTPPPETSATPATTNPVGPGGPAPGPGPAVPTDPATNSLMNKTFMDVKSNIEASALNSSTPSNIYATGQDGGVKYQNGLGGTPGTLSNALSERSLTRP